MPNTATLLENKGIAGDHIAKHSSNQRQTSLIQAEHLAVTAKLMNTNTLSAETLRRNLVVEGINLLDLKDQIFSPGDCIPLKGAIFKYLYARPMGTYKLPLGNCSCITLSPTSM